MGTEAREIARLIGEELELKSPEELTEEIKAELAPFRMILVPDRSVRKVKVTVEWET